MIEAALEGPAARTHVAFGPAGDDAVALDGMKAGLAVGPLEMSKARDGEEVVDAGAAGLDIAAEARVVVD